MGGAKINASSGSWTNRLSDRLQRNPRHNLPFPTTHYCKGAVEMKRLFSFVMLAIGLALGCIATAQAADKKPNVLVIWGDDIGYWNISAYNQGMMGYKTPNIDKIAPRKAHCSPTGTASKAAPRDAPHSSPDKVASALAT